ncbi:MAG: sulfatase [Planctomycetaceae bacterium]|nr:sulfatase [Planctomycetaceae bacterium]HAA67734.1 sulfatase [Planctomycetaceae bacterium]|tara:strand:+ start:1907 stop:3298 length:1392 start_codon:yes stop_codon:yes gene_type:complete
MDAMHTIQNNLARRAFLRHTSAGIGSVALASLLAETAQSQLLHHAPRAKRVIFLHMVGAPSHLDLFDYKRQLQQLNGQLCPPSLLEGARFAFLRGHPRLLGTRYRFHRHGESGLEMSELLPHLSAVADEIAVIKTMRTEHFNHAPAQLFLHTGFGRFGRPTMGSWVNYGLGSENRDLPGFVVLITGLVGGAGNSMWGSGFLPTLHQGIEFRSQGDPVLFLSNPAGVSRSDRHQVVESINRLNAIQLEELGDPEIETRIRQYELAYRMQSSVPELMDISREPEHIQAMYGTRPGQVSFANNCLLARRLVERGVRFVQLCDQGWDHHGSVFESLPKKCKQVDQPIAALIQDLKQRGLLDETLVVWGTEFGRTPLLQSDRSRPGRDHHKEAYSVWMAGGGIKGGVTFGETDPLGYFPADNPVDVHDWHATILHLLGVDHEQLTYKYQGRQFRLTDVSGNVLSPLLA